MPGRRIGPVTPTRPVVPPGRNPTPGTPRGHVSLTRPVVRPTVTPRTPARPTPRR